MNLNSKHCSGCGSTLETIAYEITNAGFSVCGDPQDFKWYYSCKSCKNNYTREDEIWNKIAKEELNEKKKNKYFFQK
jgi:hypothetical protein